MNEPDIERQRRENRERVARYRARKRGEPVALRKKGPRPKPLAAYAAERAASASVPPSDTAQATVADSTARRARLQAAFNSVRAELDKVDQEYAAACERFGLLLPWPNGVDLRRGEYFHLLAQLENLDGRRYHHLGPPDPQSHYLGPRALWVPGNRLVYLGHRQHTGGVGDGIARNWRLDAFAPACAWRPGSGAPTDTTLYLEAEPGRQAAEGELVIDAGEGRPITLTAHATRTLLASALFGRLEIRTEEPALRAELAELLRDVARTGIGLFAEGDQTRAAELLERAAVAVEIAGKHSLMEEQSDEKGGI